VQKIPTLFDRAWDGDHRVEPRWSSPELGNELTLRKIGGADGRLVATEKLDGTNVRVTVRSGEIVRLEARRNPTREQKARGITEPWYRDSDGMSADKYMAAAVTNTPLLGFPDGEWSAEAVGPSIQGNPLELDGHRLYLFPSPALVGRLVPAGVLVPTLPNMDFLARTAEAQFTLLEGLLPRLPSRVNPAKVLEGIVWHKRGLPVAKLKGSDFRKRVPQAAGAGFLPAGAGQPSA
jgi:hypothetical protein